MNDYVEITYYETIQQIESSTPMDTPGKEYILARFVKEKDAEKYMDVEKSRLLKRIQKDPTYPNTHTDYIVRKKKLRLIKSF